MNSKTIRESEVIVDDGARLADAQPRTPRPAVYRSNGLSACEGIVFSPEQKRRAFKLASPD